MQDADVRLQELTAELAERLVNIEDALGSLREEADRIRVELRCRIEAEGGTELPCDGFRVALDRGTPSYDHGLLAALKEQLPEDELAKVYSPAYQKMVDVAEKWSGTHLNSLERRFGGQVATTIQQARIPGTLRVVVERKEQAPATP